ncbi:CobW family GTP-binding protein [Chitinimonas koreensis]|uniref:CobW family GTP-binding protein n=1 Tax=Chitinimonas koreensis TaxID=356302 RepID=UPI00223ED2D7|nr:GTP-binding protein [Chitinimonas koreensis]
MSAAKVPVNLLTGFLGVGKTTAVRRLLADKPADQFWAVLVNEFGEVGIDGAAIEASADGLNVVEVPGGCICCTTSPMLRVSITRLLRARRPDRLLIEPSGLGHPAGIVDVLRDPYLAAALELRAVVTLVDPRHLDDARYTLNDTWRDQIALADVLVANKCDRADAAQIDRFARMAEGLYPPKLAVVTTRDGVFEAGLLDLVAEQADNPSLVKARISPSPPGEGLG